LLSSTAEESSTSHLLSKGLQQLKVLITLLAVPITSELWGRAATRESLQRDLSLQLSRGAASFMLRGLSSGLPGLFHQP